MYFSDWTGTWYKQVPDLVELLCKAAQMERGALPSILRSRLQPSSVEWTCSDRIGATRRARDMPTAFTIFHAAQLDGRM
jgi:hypothetical protein